MAYISKNGGYRYLTAQDDWKKAALGILEALRFYGEYVRDMRDDADAPTYSAYLGDVPDWVQQHIFSYGCSALNRVLREFLTGYLLELKSDDELAKDFGKSLATIRSWKLECGLALLKVFIENCTNNL